MEGGREEGSLTNGDDPTGGAGQDLDRVPRLLDPRGTDEHRAHRPPVQAGELQVLLERVDLPPEGVAPDRDVETAEGLLTGARFGDPVGQHDHAGAGPVDREAAG